MKLGIIAAMKVEAEKIISSMTEKKTEEYGGVVYTSGKIGGNEVVCAVCGIGKVFAAMCAQIMAVVYKPEYIINSGIAGTLTHNLSIGDVAISTDAVQYDMDTSVMGDPVGMISGINIIKIPASRELGEKIASLAHEHGVKTYMGTIATGDRFIGDSETKRKISEMFGGIACEMEGAAVAQFCYVNKIPFCIIRAISDSADGEALDDYPAFAARSADISADIAIKLAKEL